MIRTSWWNEARSLFQRQGDACQREWSVILKEENVGTKYKKKQKLKSNENTLHPQIRTKLE